MTEMSDKHAREGGDPLTPAMNMIRAAERRDPIFAEQDALVMWCYPGHDEEITVNFNGYGYGRNEDVIPRSTEERLREELPETWKIENRGSRIEIHPSGRFAGGVHVPDDINAVTRALKNMGLSVHTRG